MKKFRFRLDPVLRVRRLQEDLARGELLRANRDLAVATGELAGRNESYGQAPRPTGVQSSDTFHRTWFRLDAAARAVLAAEAARQARQEAADLCRDEWTAASQRVSALERLEERAHDEWAVEIRRGEDRLADDLVVSRHKLRAPDRPHRSTGDHT